MAALLVADPQITTFLAAETIPMLLDATDHVGDAPERALRIVHEIESVVAVKDSGELNMTQTIDYNQIAGSYAQTRAAAPWIVEAMNRHIAPLSSGAVIIELGCGTGNHIRALAERFPQHQYEGFDQSGAMLQEAQRIPSKVFFRQGDAQLFWPYSDSLWRSCF